MLTAGMLIGIANKKVWFLDHVRSDNSLEVVSYSPVDLETVERLSDRSYVLDNDPYDFHELWRHAVASGRTEKSYEDYAGSLFDDDEYENGSDIWFYNQDCHGVGRVLCDEPEIHERVKADMDSLLDKIVVGSWEYGNSYIIKRGCSRPFGEWQVVYSMEAARVIDAMAPPRFIMRR